MRAHRNTATKSNHIGRVISGWKVKSYYGYESQSAYYNCECISCGTEKKQTISNLERRHKWFCKKCQLAVNSIRHKLLADLINVTGQ